VTEVLIFLRIDRLQIELPQPTKADPSSAAALTGAIFAGGMYRWFSK
jgi:hypothetical protein